MCLDTLMYRITAHSTDDDWGKEVRAQTNFPSSVTFFLSSPLFTLQVSSPHSFVSFADPLTHSLL